MENTKEAAGILSCRFFHIMQTGAVYFQSYS